MLNDFRKAIVSLGALAEESRRNNAICMDIYHEAKRQSKLLTESLYRQRIAECKNEFARNYAQKHFSQADEDGLILEIAKRLGLLSSSSFIEFGIGDGTENNTICLATLGWKGQWIGGQDLGFSLSPSSNLSFRKVWVDLENISDLYIESISSLGASQYDLVSIDLDGNDYHLIERLLEVGANPSFFVCEYNSVFPPQAEWVMPYDPRHEWKGDQFFGASLLSLAKLFDKYDYFLCACNPCTGNNAFFVKTKFRESFPDVPRCIEEIYQSPFYEVGNSFSHTLGERFIASIL